MKKKKFLLHCLFINTFLLMIFTSAYPQATNEKHYNKTFFEDFNGPLDNNIWLVGTWKEHGGQLSAERCYVKDGLLNMIFINKTGEGYLGSAIQTVDEFFYGRWEASLKPSNVPGVLNSFYTIDWDDTSTDNSDSDGTKQEIDIEFLTNSFSEGKGEVHVALHERRKKSYQSNPDFSLNFNPSADFHVWGFDITPEYIEWFVDDMAIYRYTYKEREIKISAPYILKLNFWTAEKWIGGPPEENVECLYQIDWIRFTPFNEMKDLNRKSLNTDK